ncbi:hypothetical protein PM082_003780 [Marasmius tenuissimus]|nr:hypothetical protein PM082_003780 [Marasmius tenuissimus]
MQRKMATQYIYFGEDTPEEQFVNALVDRKREQLSKLDVQELAKKDVILKINLYGVRDSNGEHRIWRRFRVSAGTKLSVLQDKIMSPILGWTRNLHAYVFTDFRDGALYGPEGATSVDMTHNAQVGWKWLPDHEFMLAHLFDAEGDRFGYMYDLGDRWFHEILVETILPADKSDGRVEIIAGNGACPGENMNGPWSYCKLLNEYVGGTPTAQRDIKRKILENPNYDAFGKPPALFDPFRFDLAWAKDNLSAALASSNSVRQGMRGFVIPLHQEALVNPRPGQGPTKKGQSLVKTFDSNAGGFWEEVSTEKKDRKAVSACACCGKPGTPELVLKACGGCRQMLYCSPEHQKVCLGFDQRGNQH